MAQKMIGYTTGVLCCITYITDHMVTKSVSLCEVA